MSFGRFSPEDKQAYIDFGLMEIEYMLDDPVEANKLRPNAFFVPEGRAARSDVAAPLGSAACRGQIPPPEEHLR